MPRSCCLPAARLFLAYGAAQPNSLVALPARAQPNRARPAAPTLCPAYCRPTTAAQPVAGCCPAASRCPTNLATASWNRRQNACPGHVAAMCDEFAAYSSPAPRPPSTTSAATSVPSPSPPPAPSPSPRGTAPRWRTPRHAPASGTHWHRSRSMTTGHNADRSSSRRSAVPALCPVAYTLVGRPPAGAAVRLVTTKRRWLPCGLISILATTRRACGQLPAW